VPDVPAVPAPDVRLCKPCLFSPINHPKTAQQRVYPAILKPCQPCQRADRPVSIGLPPILESYWWKTLLNSADIKACLAFAADHEKTDPPWLLSTSGFFFYPYLLKPEILT
jgi:hypothetical protein